MLPWDACQSSSRLACKPSSPIATATSTCRQAHPPSPALHVRLPQERARYRDMEVMQSFAAELGGGGNRFYPVRRTQVG